MGEPATEISTLDSLIEAVTRSDILFLLYHLQSLRLANPEGYASELSTGLHTKTKVTALRSAIRETSGFSPTASDRASRVREFILQVLLLSGAGVIDTTGSGEKMTTKAWDREDQLMVGVLRDWDKTLGAKWDDARKVLWDPVDEKLETWLWENGLDLVEETATRTDGVESTKDETLGPRPLDDSTSASHDVQQLALSGCENVNSAPRVKLAQDSNRDASTGSKAMTGIKVEAVRSPLDVDSDPAAFRDHSLSPMLIDSSPASPPQIIQIFEIKHSAPVSPPTFKPIPSPPAVQFVANVLSPIPIHPPKASILDDTLPASLVSTTSSTSNITIKGSKNKSLIDNLFQRYRDRPSTPQLPLSFRIATGPRVIVSNLSTEYTNEKIAQLFENSVAEKIVNVVWDDDSGEGKTAIVTLAGGGRDAVRDAEKLDRTVAGGRVIEVKEFGHEAPTSLQVVKVVSGARHISLATSRIEECPDVDVAPRLESPSSSGIDQYGTEVTSRPNLNSPSEATPVPRPSSSTFSKFRNPLRPEGDFKPRNRSKSPARESESKDSDPLDRQPTLFISNLPAPLSHPDLTRRLTALLSNFISTRDICQIRILRHYDKDRKYGFVTLSSNIQQGTIRFIISRLDRSKPFSDTLGFDQVEIYVSTYNEKAKSQRGSRDKSKLETFDPDSRRIRDITSRGVVGVAPKWAVDKGTYPWAKNPTRNSLSGHLEFVEARNAKGNWDESPVADVERGRSGQTRADSNPFLPRCDARNGSDDDYHWGEKYDHHCEGNSEAVGMRSRRASRSCSPDRRRRLQGQPGGRQIPERRETARRDDREFHGSTRRLSSGLEKSRADSPISRSREVRAASPRRTKSPLGHAFSTINDVNSFQDSCQKFPSYLVPLRDFSKMRAHSIEQDRGGGRTHQNFSAGPSGSTGAKRGPSRREFPREYSGRERKRDREDSRSVSPQGGRAKRVERKRSRSTQRSTSQSRSHTREPKRSKILVESQPTIGYSLTQGGRARMRFDSNNPGPEDSIGDLCSGNASREVLVTVDFGFVPPALARRALKEPAPLFDPQTQLQYETFLKGQLGGREHFSSFFAQLSDFNERNRRFEALAEESVARKRW
ncbi:hypothetical protein P7C70_g6595, partial [Phenoliferia sp. Uapishka_3]